MPIKASSPTLAFKAPLYRPEFDLENAHYGLFPGIGDVDLA